MRFNPDLADLINEDLFFMRKSYGTYFHVHFKVLDVHWEFIEMQAGTKRKFKDESNIILSIRDTMINLYQDILHVPELWIRYSDSCFMEGKIITWVMPFYKGDCPEQDSHSWIEEMDAPIRKEIRKFCGERI